MKLLCRYYSNNPRLVAGVQVFMEKPGFRVFCLQGTLVDNKGSLKILTPTATLLVSCISPETKRGLMAILTSDAKYRAYDNKKLDTEEIPRGDSNLILCNLLKDKYSRTQNHFELEFSGEGKSVGVIAEEVDGSLQLRSTIHSVSGDVIVIGEKALAKVLKECNILRAFSYKSVTPDCEKDVTVRKSRGEILREVSHYLNRTIVIASFLADNTLLEQYISGTSVLEVMTRSDYSKVYKKISPITLRNTEPFCIYLISASVDDVAREQGRSLRK